MEPSQPISPNPSPARRELPTRWSLWGALIAVAAASLAYLVLAPTPWSEGLDVSREARETVRTRSWMTIGFWLGAALNLLLAAAALLAWHFRPAMVDAPAAGVGENGRPGRRGAWAIRLLTLAAMATAAWGMLPRLELSLWGDEEATARRTIIGNVYRMEDGSFQAKRPSWQKAAWNFDNGTNSHVLFNLLARLSHGPADQSGLDPGRYHFSEARIRLPSFLATLLLVPAAAWLTALLGHARGAPLAAFLVALHPWVVRHGSDARGYALLMLLGVVATACLIEALRRRHQARWWIAAGTAQFLLFFSHLGCIYLLAPLNLAAFWLAWSPGQPGRANPLRSADAWRLGGALLLGAMLTIQVMMPHALQLHRWLKQGRFSGAPPQGYLADTASNWALGVPWQPWERNNPFSITWKDLFQAQPAITAAATALLALLLAAGVLALISRRGARWWLLPLLLPAPLLYLDALRSGNLLYPWYTVGYLPLALVVAGAGFSALLGAAGKRIPLAGGAPACLAGLLAVALFAAATWRPRQIVRLHSVEPLGESTRYFRETINPFHPRIDETLSLGFVHPSLVYDPAVTLARSDEAFVAVIREAEARQLPLWINAANLGIAARHFPLAMELVADREVFEEPVIFHGLQQPCTRHVFRYIPGGLARHEARRSELR